MRAAAELTGTSVNKMGSRLTKAMAGLTDDFGPGGLRSIMRSVDDLPGSVPGVRSVADALSPRNLGAAMKDVMVDAKSGLSTLSRHNVSEIPGLIGQGLREFSPNTALLGHTLGSEVDDAVRLTQGFSGEALDRGVDGLNIAIHKANLNTFVPTTIDLLDQRGVFDSGKQFGQRPWW